MKQSENYTEVLSYVHENTYPTVEKIACNMFAPFTDDEGNADIEYGVRVMMSTIEDVEERHMRRALMLAFGMLVSTFAESMLDDKRLLEMRMQQADEAEQERQAAL